MQRRRRLLVQAALSGSRDSAAVARLLNQYGLDASSEGPEVSADGDVPSVFAAMGEHDIESHLAARIEDAAPGTRVSVIRATLVRGKKS